MPAEFIDILKMEELDIGHSKKVPWDAIGPKLVLIIGVLGFVARSSQVFGHDLDRFILLVEVKFFRLRGCPQQTQHVVTITF